MILTDSEIVVTGTGRVSGTIKRLHQEVTLVSRKKCQNCGGDPFPVCDILIHAGARVFADKSIEDPEPYIHDNVTGTFRMLELARERKLKLFVFLSTFEAQLPQTPKEGLR